MNFEYYKSEVIFMSTFLSILRVVVKVITVVIPLFEGIIRMLEKEGVKKQRIFNKK